MSILDDILNNLPYPATTCNTTNCNSPEMHTLFHRIYWYLYSIRNDAFTDPTLWRACYGRLVDDIQMFIPNLGCILGAEHFPYSKTITLYFSPDYEEENPSEIFVSIIPDDIDEYTGYVYSINVTVGTRAMA